MLPLAVLLMAALWAYTAWFRRASERLAHRWAQEHGLKLLWLEQCRFFWRRPRGVGAGRHDVILRFAGRSADGQTISGWLSVGTTPMSLRPNRIRVRLEGSDLPGGYDEYY